MTFTILLLIIIYYHSVFLKVCYVCLLVTCVVVNRCKYILNVSTDVNTPILHIVTVINALRLHFVTGLNATLLRLQPL